MRSHLLPTYGSSALALAALLTLGGCDEPGELAVTDADAVTERDGCSFGCCHCSLNAPLVNSSYVGELNLVGLPNSSGVRLLNIKNPQTHTTYEPGFDMSTHRLLARDSDGATVFSGAQMVGKVLTLKTPDGPVALKIIGYDDAIPSWSSTGSPITIYRLQYTQAGVVYPICPNGEAQTQHLVTLIGGELYDRTTNDIIGDMPDWFTLACVAEAAYKMKLMDYQPQGNRHATYDQRQTTLRMITADYCGDGTPYTEDGTAVGWRNADNTVVPTVAENDLEAKWGPDGATCLDIPRLADPAEVHCSIPACDGDTSFASAEWRTMTP